MPSRKLADKIGDNVWIKDDGEQQSENRAVKVGVVVDVIARIPRGPYAITQVEEGK